MKIGKSLLKALPLAISMIFFWSCVDEFDVFTPATPSGDIDQFFSATQSLSQSFIMNPASGDVIVTENKSLIHIPPDAFITQEGGIPTGPVHFEIVEIHDKGSLILYNVPTVSDGRLLESDGVFYLQARMGNETLNLAEDKRIMVQSSDSDPRQGMELFYGATGNDSLFNWSPVESTTGNWTAVRTSEWAFQDSLESWFDFGYEFFTDSLTWINVDIFVDIPEEDKTEVCIELPEIYTNKNTIVYMVFKDLSSVVALTGDADKQLFCEPYGLVPIGYEVCFVVISNQGDQVYHFALQPAVIMRDHIEMIIPEETPLDEILELLRQL